MALPPLAGAVKLTLAEPLPGDAKPMAGAAGRVAIERLLAKRQPPAKAIRATPLIVDAVPPALAGMHYFGLVQAVGAFRSSEWVDFYRQLLGFRQLTEADFVGILPKGTLLQSPCGRFYLQLVEPPEGAEDIHWDDGLVRIGFGTPDVLEATRLLQERGVVFIDEGALHPGEKGALTQVYLGSVTFELVASRPARA